MKAAPDARNLPCVPNLEGFSRRRFLLGTLLGPSVIPLAGSPRRHHNWWLLQHGANAAIVNTERRSALMLAESEGHQAVVKLLVAK